MNTEQFCCLRKYIVVISECTNYLARTKLMHVNKVYFPREFVHITATLSFCLRGRTIYSIG